ncbi:hypothetical protein [Robiginitalea biformata]|uniref:Uncharacterized protein n=1 Tax=Robiginitalea biformata (strain ATCC BAA-864 / DSM 15991 / KCTC 12146 / HTCC2501) TaxID=313596 RepID=A4CPU9_ROBBH|nr:hypothetical protein [Robiginitalea biformata]EAR14034.1 hypothetical protein RB2501_01370 [Robiginitalea biformata HTCC2501]
MKNRLENKLSLLLEEFPDMQCYLAALLLQSEFGGEILYNVDHCVLRVYCPDSGTVLYADTYNGVSDEPPGPLHSYQPMPMLKLKSIYGWEEQKELIRAAMQESKTPPHF